MAVMLLDLDFSARRLHRSQPILALLLGAPPSRLFLRLSCVSRSCCVALRLLLSFWGTRHRRVLRNGNLEGLTTAVHVWTKGAL